MCQIVGKWITEIFCEKILCPKLIESRQRSIRMREKLILVQKGYRSFILPAHPTQAKDKSEYVTSYVFYSLWNYEKKIALIHLNPKLQIFNFKSQFRPPSNSSLIRAKYAIADIVQVGSGICSDRGVVTSLASHWSVSINPGLSLVNFPPSSSRLNAVASGLSDAFIELVIVNGW